jgi:putative flippase GtrA
MNVLLECPRRGIPIREIPIEAIYLARNETSHFNAVTDSIRIYREILRFAFSSLTGFAVDYSLYSLLVYLTVGLGTAPSVTLSNIAARVVSAAVNYAVNRRFVFKSKNNAVKSALSYAALAACILAGNTVLLNALVEAAGMNRYAAKLITELTFFSVSWLIQRSLIFRKDDGKAGRRPAGKGSFSAGRKYLRGGQQAEQMRIAEGLGAAGGR